MFERLPVLFRSAMYALRGGFLVRPMAIALVLGIAGAVLSALEEELPGIGAWIPGTLFPSHEDPNRRAGHPQHIATSIMTVVSIVFAILLMTLTLASTQFSPRILIGFVRDRTTQGTLGVSWTFAYCMAALPAARCLPHPFVPVATVMGAMVLALVCVGWLIYFINHVSHSISVNHIVDRIARETELVIDEFMPYPRGPFQLPDRSEASTAEHGTAILNRQSGYIRYVNINRLVALAKTYQICVHLERRVGQFVPSGVPLMRVSKPERVPADRALHLMATFDIGPARTMQQDVEFGVIQIVDIALRAMSPAVNDPSTAISCVDQLSRIMIFWTSRVPPPSHYFAPPHVLRLFVPWIGFDGLLDTAFEQIRHYAVADVAVSLRLVRALADIASTIEHADLRAKLLERARRVNTGCKGHLPDAELRNLQQRFDALEAMIASSIE